MALSIGEVTINVTENQVELWFVMGVTNHCYPTKIAAETAARLYYHPGKDSNSVVYYHRFHDISVDMD